ncbi:MAG: thiamine pyrophosphate-dependent enzyme [Arhodomonas sp.]|nr:thiamine pyrophosphate-dependent enzyme [Arhodomonas sp.]
MRTAFEVARSGRPGPVVVDLPKDVQNWVGEFRGRGPAGISVAIGSAWSRCARPSSRSASAGSSSSSSATRQRPLLYVGGGVINSDAGDALTEFAHAFGVPVVTTVMGLGALDTTDDLSLHMLGMHGTAYANYAVEDCDFIIAVGSRFDDRVAAKAELFAPMAEHVAHIDIDAAEIGKVKMVDWAHVGDAGRSLRQLVEFGRHEGFRRDFGPWLEHVRGLREKYPMNFDRENPLIQPQHVLELLNGLTKGDAIVSTGVGQHQMFAAQYLDFQRPRQWLTSGSMGTMGFGLPAAIGAPVRPSGRPGHRRGRRRQHPHEPRRDGDGDHLQPAGEDPAAQQQRRRYGPPVAASCTSRTASRPATNPCTARTSSRPRSPTASGSPGGSPTSPSWPRRWRPSLAHAGPAFLEVVVDPDAGVYPMVGPGMSYREMVTGEHIGSRDHGGPDDRSDRLSQSEMF